MPKRKKTTSYAISDSTKQAVKEAAQADKRSASQWLEIQLRQLLGLDEPKVKLGEKDLLAIQINEASKENAKTD